MGFQYPPASGTEVAQMLQALTNSSLVTANMLQELGGTITRNYQNQLNNQGYRQLKPKREIAAVTCQNAETLMEELLNFEIDMQELGVVEKAEAALFQLRSVAVGQAKDVIEYAMAKGDMRQCHAQGLQLPHGPKTRDDGLPDRGFRRHQMFVYMYNKMVDALRKSVHLTSPMTGCEKLHMKESFGSNERGHCRRCT
jgi:hypothetical protein